MYVVYITCRRLISYINGHELYREKEREREREREREKKLGETLSLSIHPFDRCILVEPNDNYTAGSHDCS